MSKADTIQTDLVAAMKSKDAARVSVLRLVKTALKNKEIELGKGLSEDDENQVLQTLVKQRNEAIETFDKAGREDLAQKERDEKTVILSYLPEPASSGEIESTVAAVIEELGIDSPKEMGRVMKEAMARLKKTGKTVDGKAVNAAARAKLS